LLDVVALTAEYETWLALSLPVVVGDLALKHRELAADEMQFLRETYYL